MFATRLPSTDNRIDKSVPKFGARCTINRPIGPFGVGAGVARGRACMSATDASIAHKIDIVTAKCVFISSVLFPAYPVLPDSCHLSQCRSARFRHFTAMLARSLLLFF